MENSVMLSAVCNEPVSLKVLEEPFYRKGFSPFVNKETGTWWEYDDDKKGFFDTGIIAQGRDGNDYVITEQDYNTIVERTLSNVNPTLDEKLSSKLPKSPLNWEQWTAEEQAAARERMGIPGDYELIEEITLQEDVTWLSRSKEPDGTPYRFSAFCIIAEIIVSDSETSNYMRLDASSKETINLFLEYFSRDNIRNKRINVNYEALSPNLFRLSSEINDKKTVLFSKGNVSVRNLSYNGTPILSTIVKSINIGNITLCAGTKIKIYGVRA